MKMDKTAAAFGLFQIVFSEVTERLAASLYSLRKLNDPDANFEKLWHSGYAKMLSAFRSELKQFDGREPSDHVMAIRRVCDDMSDLNVWRKARIHARVRQTPDGYALFDAKTKRRLSISASECEQQIQKAVRILIELDVHMSGLIASLNLEQEIERLFEDMVDRS